MADISPEAVNTARKSGYSDDEIVSFLAQKAPDQFKTAQEAGYSSKDILDHLGTKQNTSYMGAVSQGVSDVASGIGKTLKDYGISPDAGAVADKVAQKTAPANYKSATEDFMNRGGAWYDKNWSSAPRALVENAPALTTDVLAGLAGKKLGGTAGAAVGSGLSYLLRTRGEAAEGRAAERTGDPNATPNTQDKTISALSGIPEAALASLGASRFVNPARIAGTGVRGALEAGGKLATTAGIEGGVGAGQDVIGQVAQTAGTPGGVRVDPGQTFGAAALNAGTGAGLASVHAGGELNNARRFRDFDTEASQSVANRIQANAEGDLGNVKTARKAVGATEADIKSDLSHAFSADPNAKAQIDANDAARRSLARFNSGEQVTDTDLNSIAQATSGTAASDRIAALTRETIALRKLKDLGNYSDNSFKGGISNKMEQGVRAIYNPAGAITGASLAAAGLSQPAMAAGVLSSAPTAVIGSIGAYGLARALDKATGYRSPADTFVKKFGGTPSATPGIVQAPQPQRPGPTGPSIPQASTFNGKVMEPPFGSAPVATPADLAKRDSRLSNAVDTALTRGVDQQNRDDTRQDNSVERGADFIGRTAVAQIRGDARLQAMKDRAAAVAERQGLVEQKQDAQGLMASRTALAKAQQQDATQAVQARRANDALEKRGVSEMKQDAQGLMASRQSPNGLDRAQMGDARELMAARRAHEKLQAQQERAASDAENARQAIGSDGEMSGQTMKAAQQLLKSLSAVNKIKERVLKSQAALDKQQVASEKRTSDKPNGKTKTLDDYPEAPWAYETPKVAGQMAYDYQTSKGTTSIRNPEGFKRGAANRIEATRDLFAGISKEVSKSDLPKVETAMNRMLSVRNESDAKNFRDAMKAAMPDASAVIDKHLTDEWINKQWTPQRSKLH